jgi:hypothetical protein
MQKTLSKNNKNSISLKSSLQHGLLWHDLRNKLAKLGINIRPYYWVQEEFTTCKEPLIKGNVSEYSCKLLGVKEVNKIIKSDSETDEEEIRFLFKKGNLCIGLEHENKIANYMFIELNDFVYLKKSFPLKKNEAFLLYMWTNPEYRGKSLAPYLRYQAYKILKDQGRNIKYSTTDYFNNSSFRFKKKLHSKHLKLYVFINLFKKIHWTFLLKTYP